MFVAEQRKEASLDPLEPPSLPDLTHADATLDLDYTGAGIGQGSLGQTLTWMALLRGEIPLTTRAWHFGAAWDFASAASEGRGRTLIYGNPEVWVRGAGWHASGLVGGGGLGIVIPMPRDLDADGRSVLDAVRVIRPWDSAYFASDALTLRPTFDARLVLEPFVLQLRQGLDWSFDFSRDRSDILARIGSYFAVSPLPWTALGVELWQTYSVTQEVRDDQRAAITLAPSARVRLGPVQPGVSVLFPITTPLEGIARDYFAVRIHVRLALGETAELTY